ncbi:Thiamine pyrophosphokinase [Caloramator mitchellensis]|uniref:Thiamine diphosphokinase n=1 Tax=Caloramator mitchellensis TaxID=908809 RepID=A0A0R3K1T7_CALMK|nr:thiamine diphosphokinase [Caloramator mitchellensis]KRQ86933.1 Thiamine pyrophosphokinase [Caloramator mitchellensis]
MKKAVVFNYGKLDNLQLIKNELKNTDYIFCADGGANYVYEIGLVPDFLIGDFDSINMDVLSEFQNKGINIIQYPQEKDFTDTELCINKAIEMGCSVICIIGGVGGRIDHTLANLNILHYINTKGAKGYFVTDEFNIYLVSNEIELIGSKGDLISIIPIFNDAKGLSTKGLKYGLENSTIEFGKPLGISNIMVENRCEIKIKKGEVLVFKQNKIVSNER